MRRLFRQAGLFFHSAVASSHLAARAYFAALPWLAHPLSVKGQQRLRNSIDAVKWPAIALRPRRVIVGGRTEVWLHPHFNEVDLEAALGQRLSYEHEVFTFLETRMPAYGAVIEIGANVGLFTTFFARWLADRTPAGRVYAFEPSRQAYERLLQNLAANASNNVLVFNCAIADETTFLPFFEPEGHLTNGSLIAGFAAQFSQTVSSMPVLVLDGGLVERLPEKGLKVLLKIDVEGSEARVLRSLERFIRSSSPDIVIEVLAEFEGELNELRFLRDAGYAFFNLTPHGALLQPSIKATMHRDYFLTTSPLPERTA
jgi:FkbM family methyltransferase